MKGDPRNPAMSEFHNPYHFVPVADNPGPGCVQLDASASPRWPADPPPHLTHDRFVKETKVDGRSEPAFSGRIVCRLTVCELLAIGAQQTTGDKKKNSPRAISLFKLGTRWAIPGSSLRGMISALAEAASNSAFRILKDEPYSRSAGKGVPRKALGNAFAYFKEHYPEHVPLHFQDGRSRLSLAEQLFGVVELVHGKAKTPDDWRALSLAGRVRFSHALASAEVVQTSMETTQILDSPKAPSPSLYLHPKNDPEGGYIHRLDPKPKDHRPHGRKFYLHREELHSDDWISRTPDDQAHQKARVAPLFGGEFWFHLDFDNLSQLELELLCYSLTPSDAFHHKLGMGKPLGLGKVKLAPAGLFLVDRPARYSVDSLIGSPRYHHIWMPATALVWPAEYAAERDAPASSPAPRSPVEHRAAYRERVATHFSSVLPILDALELLGDPAKVQSPVHYPQPLDRESRKMAGAPKGSQDKTLNDVTGPELERNSYEWFVANDDAAGQYLRSLTRANTCDFKEIPTLDRNRRAEPPMPSCWLAGHPPDHLLSPREMTPADYEGKTGVPFRLVEIKPNGKMRFEIDISGTGYPGFLPPNDLIFLRALDLQVGDSLPFDVVKFNSPSFQLRFKKPAAT